MSMTSCYTFVRRENRIVVNFNDDYDDVVASLLLLVVVFVSFVLSTDVTQDAPLYSCSALQIGD
jgi:hypothetical protein